MSDLSSLEKDLRAIEAVNQRDVQFALANGAELMMSQWTDDIGEAVHTCGKIMRILQRQPDGSWKIHRTIAMVD